MRGAPASSVANTLGWPSVGTRGDGLEAGVAGQAHHELAALRHPAVLGGDGGLPHPFLQALHAFGVALLDLGLDGGERVAAARARRERASAAAGGGGRAQELATGVWRHGA